MKIGRKIVTVTAGLAFAALGMLAQSPDATAPQSSGASQGPGQGSGQGYGQGRGGMRGMGSGRGVLGTVTAVTADHYTVKTDAGDLYTVHFSVNTRIMKQPAGQGPAGQAGGQPGWRARGEDGDRPQPQPLKATDIKVGDAITVGGEVDAAAKSVGAVFILQLDPERAKQMRDMEANYGKTWLAGRITAIEGTTITIEGAMDHTTHAIAVDENTSLRQRRDSITLADIKPGEQLRAEGAVKDGVFLATTVNAMVPPNPADRPNRDRAPGEAKPAPPQ